MTIDTKEIYLVTKENVMQQLIIKNDQITKVPSMCQHLIKQGQDADTALIIVRLEGMMLKELKSPQKAPTALNINDVHEETSQTMKKGRYSDVWSTNLDR